MWSLNMPLLFQADTWIMKFLFEQILGVAGLFTQQQIKQAPDSLRFNIDFGYSLGDVITLGQEKTYM